MPSSRSTRYALAVLLLPVAMQQAAAQDCSKGAWPTKQFEVIHRRTPADIELWLSGLVEGVWNGDEIEEARSTADEAWDRLIEEYLHDIATRLEAAGFGCPDLLTIYPDGVPKYPLYLVDLGDHIIHRWSPAAGVYVSNPIYPFYPSHIIVDREPFALAREEWVDQATSTLARTEWEERLYGILAHELFHAVQAAYDDEHDSLRRVASRFIGSSLPFAVEGMANGVEAFMISQRFPGFREALEDRQTELGGYAYDYESFVVAPMDLDKAYETGSFWLHVAERYGGLSTLEYFLRQPLEGLTTADRVRWVEQGLSEQLFAAFPHFLTELASYGWSRYEAVAPELWLGWTLYQCREADSSDPGPPLRVTLDGTNGPWRLPAMPELTGRCIEVVWNLDLPPSAMESVALQIELVAPQAAALGQLHVGLAHGTMQDSNCWERVKGLAGPALQATRCVIEPDGLAIETAGEWSRTWTLEPGDFGTDGSATFVITNVAENSWATLPVEGIVVRARFLASGARVSFSETVSGGEPLAIALAAGGSEYAVTGERLRFGINGVRRSDGACMVLLDLPSGEGDLVTLAGVLPAPLAPGEYSVKTDFSAAEPPAGTMQAQVWPNCENGRCSPWGGSAIRGVPYTGTFRIARVNRRQVVGSFDIIADDEPIRVNGTFRAPLGGGRGLPATHPCAPRR